MTPPVSGGLPEQGLPGESPWEIEHPRQKGSNATRGKEWYVSSRDGFQRGGVECATEAEAIDVRDALNAVANGVPLTAQIAKLVDDINNTFAPRIKDLMAENEKLRAALERPRPAPPAPEPTHSPWEVERTYTRPMASTDNWGPGPYFVVRREPGEWCACSLVEERANAVRDTLNALANGVPLTAQISKLVGDINNVFAARIRELLEENDRLRGSRFQFPAEALSARIDALTPEQLLEIARAVEQSGGRMMQKSSVLRAALRAVLGEG